MELFYVIGLLIFAIVLVIVEIIFVPGTTVVGIAGVICGGYGVFLSYQYYGNTVGTLVLIGSLLVGLFALIYAFKSRSWERFSLKSTMIGKFNDERKLTLSVGDQGQSLSSLKPFGKAIFEEQEVEVRSLGGYVNPKQPVKIIKIDHNNIYVEPIT
jgi:membrane-bound ClpP family serine protease